MLTHLRGGVVRAEYRTRAIDRSFELFEARRDDGAPDAEVGGHGLLVVQRSLLAAEDLGGLMHALAQPTPWAALRGTNMPELDAAFARAADEPRGVLENAYRLISEQQLSSEGFAEDELVALGRLRSRTYSCWARMLQRVAEFWASTASIAKATMHGFPVLAGSLVLGPPPAGQLAEIVGQVLQDYDPGRFAVAIPAKREGSVVETEVIPVPLNDDAVAHYRGSGITAARLYSRLCEAHANSIMSGHSAMLSDHLLHTLPDEDRALVESLFTTEPTKEL
jgi:hypothetical protein